MKKTLACSALACAFALTVAGCAGVTSGAGSAPAAGTTGVSAPAAAPAPAAAADVPAGSGVTSVADVRAGAGAPVTLCSQRPTDEAMAQLRRAWERCYIQHGAPSGAASPYHVRTESAAGRQTLVLRGAQDSIVAIADFSTTTQCATRIVARGATPAFNRAAENTGVWLRDPNAPSLDGTCR